MPNFFESTERQAIDLSTNNHPRRFVSDCYLLLGIENILPLYVSLLDCEGGAVDPFITKDYSPFLNELADISEASACPNSLIFALPSLVDKCSYNKGRKRLP